MRKRLLFALAAAVFVIAGASVGASADVSPSIDQIGTPFTADTLATGTAQPTTTILSNADGYVNSTLILGPGVKWDPTESTDGPLQSYAPSGYHWVSDKLTAYNLIGQRVWEWRHDLKWSFANWKVQGVQVNRSVPVANDWGWNWGGTIFVYFDPKPLPQQHIWSLARAKEDFCIPYCWKSQYPEIDFRVNGAGNLTGEKKWVDGS